MKKLFIFLVVLANDLLARADVKSIPSSESVTSRPGNFWSDLGFIPAILVIASIAGLALLIYYQRREKKRGSIDNVD